VKYVVLDDLCKKWVFGIFFVFTSFIITV